MLTTLAVFQCHSAQDYELVVGPEPFIERLADVKMQKMIMDQAPYPNELLQNGLPADCTNNI